MASNYDNDGDKLIMMKLKVSAILAMVITCPRVINMEGKKNLLKNIMRNVNWIYL